LAFGMVVVVVVQLWLSSPLCSLRHGSSRRLLLVATCRFKDTGWVSLFEAGKMREMDHDICHAHFRDAPPGPPTSWVPPNPPSSDDEPPTSLWRGEGRAGILSGNAGDRAHIPQQRGGAKGG